MRTAAVFFSLILAIGEIAQAGDIFDALRRGDVPMIKALIEKTPQILESRDGNGRTPLHYAAWGGDAGFISYLIDKGAKPGLQDSEAQTPLHLAAMKDRKDAVAELVRRGSPLKTRDDYGRTALIACAREQGSAATGRVLIEAGANVNAADRFGDSALSLATWRGKTDFVELLLEKGARVPKSGPKWQGMLFQAASQGLTTLFQRLIEKTRDLKAAVPSGESLLHAAAAGGSAAIVDLLLDKGYDPARPDVFGWTPLHYAARDGRTEIVRNLIEKGAPLNARTIMGQTAYNVALERKMEAVAGLLGEMGADKSDIRFPVLEGDYLGQKPPGDEPELFAPGIVSSIWGLHSTAVFTPDGNEVYWAPMVTYPGETYSRGGLLTMRRVDGRWMPPAWVPFSGPDSNDDVPFLSTDGRRLYFLSGRPRPTEGQTEGEGIWFADRTESGWGDPRPLDANVNSMIMHWEFSVDSRHTVYFGGQGVDSRGMGDIFRARLVGGKYERPINLGEPVSSAAHESTPFIAPDGSYLLFSREGDLWISFEEASERWSSPVNLGPDINGPSNELCPIVTADGKYLFFLSQRDGESRAYWVSARVIETLRPKRPK